MARAKCGLRDVHCMVCIVYVHCMRTACALQARSEGRCPLGRPRASGRVSLACSVSKPYMLVGLRLLPSGLAMTPLAEIARSAKKRLESSPETREI